MIESNEGLIDGRPDSAPSEEAGAEWSHEPLAHFLASAWRNTVYSFTAERERFRALAEVDAIYRRLVCDSGVNEERLSAAFLVRSHASFLAAASLGLSGQVAESYALMRTALEAALHGVYIGGDCERQQYWLRRIDDPASEARAAEMLDGEAPLAHLEKIDAETARVYQQLYARTIHRTTNPNTYANLARLTRGTDITREYFVSGDDVQRSCLRSAAQVGICCLSMFYYVFGQRYRELELGQSINKLRREH